MPMIIPIVKFPRAHCPSTLWRRSRALWHTDEIQPHRTWSTLAQVMACCLTHPVITWTNVDFLFVRFCSIHLGEISQRVSEPPFCIMRLKIIPMKVLPHLQRVNELRCPVRRMAKVISWVREVPLVLTCISPRDAFVYIHTSEIGESSEWMIYRERVCWCLADIIILWHCAMSSVAIRKNKDRVYENQSQWTGLSLVRVIFCRMFGFKFVWNQCCVIIHWNLGGKL